MESKYLLNNEEIISQSKDFSVTLTNYRIRHEYGAYSNTYVISIFLEKISSIEIRYKSSPLLLVIGVFFSLASVYIMRDSSSQLPLIGFVISGLLILTFFLSRRHTITIASDGGTKINFNTKGMHRDAILHFINKIESAKNDIRLRIN
jgi:hypothetical protein